MKGQSLLKGFVEGFKQLPADLRRASRSSIAIALASLTLLVGGLTYVLAVGAMNELPGSEEKIIKGKNYLDRIELSAMQSGRGDSSTPTR